MTKPVLITPDLARWKREVEAADVLADAVDYYMKHTGNSDAGARQAVLASLIRYRDTRKGRF